MLVVDDLAAGGTKNLRHTPRGLVTLMNGICTSIIFWVPAPWGLGEGPNGQISLNLNYKVNFKDFKPNFVYLLTNERYITYQMGYSFGRLGHTQRWDLGVLWGLGVNFFFFQNSTRFGV